jgi:hypothetical protein
LNILIYSYNENESITDQSLRLDDQNNVLQGLDSKFEKISREPAEFIIPEVVAPEQPRQRPNAW